jgi:hypothetical protein
VSSVEEATTREQAMQMAPELAKRVWNGVGEQQFALEDEVPPGYITAFKTERWATTDANGSAVLKGPAVSYTIHQICRQVILINRYLWV